MKLTRLIESGRRLWFLAVAFLLAVAADLGLVAVVSTLDLPPVWATLLILAGGVPAYLLFVLASQIVGVAFQWEIALANGSVHHVMVRLSPSLFSRGLSRYVVSVDDAERLRKGGSWSLNDPLQFPLDEQGSHHARVNIQTFIWPRLSLDVDGVRIIGK